MLYCVALLLRLEHSDQKSEREFKFCTLNTVTNWVPGNYFCSVKSNVSWVWSKASCQLNLKTPCYRFLFSSFLRQLFNKKMSCEEKYNVKTNISVVTLATLFISSFFVASVSLWFPVCFGQPLYPKYPFLLKKNTSLLNLLNAQKNKNSNNGRLAVSHLVH